MLTEQKMDRVKFHGDVKQYFRDVPTSPFTVFDDGKVQLEQPENYSLYGDISRIDTLLVKVGTSILTHKDYRRTIYNMNCLSEDLTRLKKERKLNVLLVSSGAIGLGRKSRLRRGEKIPEKEKYSPEQRRVDAVEGQNLLYELWRHHFYPQPISESLVTHDDIRYPEKNVKLLQKYERLLLEGKIPVINEDDARSLEEIDISLKGERVFTDNDSLASLHVQFLKRNGYNPLLVLLSNTDGIYLKKPTEGFLDDKDVGGINIFDHTKESFTNREYTPIRIVKSSVGLEEHALPISSTRGRGGVISKIEASRYAASDGIDVVIANGQFCNHDALYQERKEGSNRKYRVLDSILDGKVVGTRFLPHKILS